MKPTKILTRLTHIEDRFLFESIMISTHFEKKIGYGESYFSVYIKQLGSNEFSLDGENIKVKSNYSNLLENLIRVEKAGIIVSYEKISNTLYKIHFETKNFHYTTNTEIVTRHSMSSTIFTDVLRGIIKGTVSLVFDLVKIFM